MESIRQLPPHDLEAEYATLGSVLIDPSCIRDVIATGLLPESFYEYRNRMVWNAILRLYERGVVADTLTVNSEIGREKLDEIGGESYVVGLVSFVPNSLYAVDYANIVCGKHRRRKGLARASEMARLVYDEDMTDEEYDDKMAAIGREISGSKPRRKEKTQQDLSREFRQRLEDARDGIYHERAYPFPIDGIDLSIEPGVTVIAARPNVGKTAMAIQWLLYQLFHKNPDTNLPDPVGFISAEMPTKQINVKLVSYLSRIPYKRLVPKHGAPLSLSEEEFELATRWSDWLEDKPIHYCADTSVEGIVSFIKDGYYEKGIDLFFVDYYQKIASPRGVKDRLAGLQEISRILTSLTVELPGLTIVIGAQITKESAKRGGLPTLADVAECDKIVQDSAQVYIIHSFDDIESNKEVSDYGIISAKDRFGKKGVTPIKFFGKYGIFEKQDERQHRVGNGPF